MLAVSYTVMLMVQLKLPNVPLYPLVFTLIPFLKTVKGVTISLVSLPQWIPLEAVMPMPVVAEYSHPELMPILRLGSRCGQIVNKNFRFKAIKEHRTRVPEYEGDVEMCRISMFSVEFSKFFLSASSIYSTSSHLDVNVHETNPIDTITTVTALPVG